MTSDKIIHVLTECKVAYNDVYRSWSVHFHATHEQMLARIKEKIFDNADYAKLPRWAKNYLQGYNDALFYSLYDNLEWRIVYNGEWISPKLIDYMDQNLVDSSKGGHFWKGTDKMWAGNA